jgi:hypothetical protein
MRRLLAIAALSACISTCAGCGDDTTTTTSPSRSSTPTAAPISFGGLRGGTAGGMGAPAFGTYFESGFTVLSTSGNWTVDASGNLGPSIAFWAPSGTTVNGTIQVTADEGTFSFKSVDLYSSTTPVPYTIAGLRNSTTRFTMTATRPLNFGVFATVVNPQAGEVIDRLVISLSNPAGPCPTCANQMGIDNVVVTR